MKKKISILLCLTLLMTTLSISTSFAMAETKEITEPELVGLSISGEKDYSAGYEVLEAFNQVRSRCGLEPLQFREELTDAAMTRAFESCINNTRNVRPDGSPKTSVLAGLDQGPYGEWINIGYIVPQAIVSQNLEMLNNPDIKSVGIACFRDESNQTHWAIIFDDVIGTPEKRSEKVTEKQEVKALKENIEIVVRLLGGIFSYEAYPVHEQLPLSVYVRSNDSLLNKVDTPLNLQDFYYRANIEKSQAEVDENGMPHIYGAGNFVIDAILKDNPEVIGHSKCIEVEKAIPSISWGSAEVLRPGQNFKLNVKTNSTGKITYSSNEPSIATVSEDGTVTCHDWGLVEITINIAEDKNYTARTIHQSVKSYFYLVDISESSTLNQAFDSKPLKLRLELKPGQWTKFTSSNPDVATVDTSGVVYFHKVGNTKIKVSIFDERDLIVKTLIVDMDVTKRSQTIMAEDRNSVCGGNSFSLNAESNRKLPLTYKNYNTKVVKVSSTGKVTPIGPGRAKIKITAPETDEYRTDEKWITITVRPKRIVTTSSAALGGRKIKIKWKRDSAVDGYQIIYARNKSFTKSVHYNTISGNRITSKTFTGLMKNNTYYFKVRSYKNSDGTKIYSTWSKYRYRTCR